MLAPTPDAGARHTLVHGHLSLALHLARRYAGRGVETDDLVQVANLALVKAARRFDPERGAFAPYATATIRGDLKKYFRDQAWSVRPPRRLQELQAAIASRWGTEPAPDDLVAVASDLEVEPGAVTEALAARGCFTPSSMDRPVGESGTTLSDTVPADDCDLERIDDWVVFCGLCRELGAADRELLRLRFVEDRTQQEIADRLGVSQMQVSRRLRSVLDGMRSRVEPAA